MKIISHHLHSTNKKLFGEYRVNRETILKAHIRRYSSSPASTLALQKHISEYMTDQRGNSKTRKVQQHDKDKDSMKQ